MLPHGNHHAAWGLLRYQLADVETFYTLSKGRCKFATSKKLCVLIVGFECLPKASVKRMILSDAPEVIYEGAAISIASLPCKVKDYIGDVSHYLRDPWWDTDKSKEL